jgi:hypothetical protein
LSNISGLGSSVDLQPASPYAKTAPDANLLGQPGKTPLADSEISSTPTTTTYNLHNITRTQLQDLVALFQNGALSTGGGHAQSGNAFSAAPGSTLTDTLLDIIGPTKASAGAADSSGTPGTIDLFRTLSNQINFLQSIGASQGTTAPYRNLLNTITSLTEPDGTLTTLNAGASL